MSILSRIFGRRKSFIEGLTVMFYKDAIYHGEHGEIRVSHKKFNLDEEVVSFVFVGMSTPPHLDVALMSFIWEEAKAQGYIPHNLVSYGRDSDVVKYPERHVDRQVLQSNSPRADLFRAAVLNALPKHDGRASSSFKHDDFKHLYKEDTVLGEELPPGKVMFDPELTTRIQTGLEEALKSIHSTLDPNNVSQSTEEVLTEKYHSKHYATHSDASLG